MSPVQCIIVCVAALVVTALVTSWLCKRRSRRPPELTVHMKDVATHPHESERGDWYVRLKAALSNHTPSDINIAKVRFDASMGRGQWLDSKEVCADVSRSAPGRHHPPDITMRLPIIVPPEKRVEYVFDVFFASQLHRCWSDGQLRIQVESREGTAAGDTVTLPPPQRG